MRRFNFYKRKADRRAAQLYLKQKEARCVICRSRHNLVVDHDHYTDLIRGVLCNTCNSGLGMFHDSPRKLRRAIHYLEVSALEAARWEVLECWLGSHLSKEDIRSKIENWKESGILNLGSMTLQYESPEAQELIKEVLERP